MNANVFSRALLGTTALSLVLVASVASAQEAQQPAAENTNPDDTIVVTGIRGALQNAAQTKRNANTFVDSVTASDVSALPDASVAEALGRIPGVSVSRYSILPQYNTGGAGGASGDFPSAEGSGNLIRGLSFVRSEFNGRDQFTANGGRALDWSSIPPELVGGVDVYKNSSAELIEGGIGGTINLRTLEPFDHAGPLFAISGDATYADLRKEWSPSISVVASNRWQTARGEFGLMASYSDSKLASNINDWQIGAPIPRVNPTVVENQGPPPVGTPVSSVIGTIPVFQLRHNEQDRDRTSYYIAGQWRDEHTTITAKYINVFNATDTVEHTVEHLPDSGTPTNTLVTGTMPTASDPTPTTLPTTRPYSGTVALCNIGYSGAGGCSQPVGIGQLMTEGWINGSGPDGGAYGYAINTLGRGVVDRSRTEDFSLNIKHDFNEQWHLNLDLQYTKASASQTEIWAGGQTHFMVREVADLDNGHVEFVEDPRGNGITAVKPGLSPTAGSANTGDPSAYWWLYNADNEQRGTGDLYAVRADMAYDFADNNWFQDLKFGVRYSERNQVNETANQNWAGVAPPWIGGGASPLSAFPQSDLLEVDDYRDFFRGGLVQGANSKFVYISRDYLLNYAKMANLFATEPLLAGSFWQPRVPMFPADNRSDITETTENFYAQLDFHHEFGGSQSIEGNFGVRYAKTDLNSNGNLVRVPFAAESACTPGTVGVPPNDVTTTAGACSRNSPQDFLPETAAYLALAAAPIDYSTSDDHYLPSLNVKWNLNDDMLIRFGASQNLTRPNVQDMRAYTTYSAGTVTVPWPTTHCGTLGLNANCNDGFQDINLVSINAGGGNPRLKPTTSDNFDLSFEWYFDGGYASAAVFTKKLHDVISGGSETLGNVTLDGTTVPITYGGQVNTRSVDLNGVELAYQQFYDFLPGPLSHLGAQANFTYIDATSDADSSCTNNGETCRYNITNLFGQSKYLVNVVGIYQDEHFEARLAYSWRDRYLIVKGDYMTGNPTFNKPAGFLDGSIKYNLNEHLQFRGSIENMLDTHTEAEMQVDAAGHTLDRFSIVNDRRFILGFRYQY